MKYESTCEKCNILGTKKIPVYTHYDSNNLELCEPCGDLFGNYLTNCTKEFIKQKGEQMDASKLKDFSYHSVNWMLSSLSQSLQVVGRLQVNQEPTEEEKSALDIHRTLILNYCHFLAPFVDVAEKLFPQHKSLLDWIKSTFNEALDKNVLKACVCSGCIPKDNISA